MVSVITAARSGVMRMSSVLAFLLLTAPLGAAEKEKPKLAIHVGKVITCAGEPITDATILVADGKIQAIGPRAKIATPAGYEVVDHTKMWAMPGLIDAHSHVGGTQDI